MLLTEAQLLWVPRPAQEGGETNSTLREGFGSTLELHGLRQGSVAETRCTFASLCAKLNGRRKATDRAV
jgi:hypothetical protein